MKCKYISNIMIEDEMVGWHHQLKGHKFEQALGVGDGQESLECCGPWGHKSQTRLSKCTELKIVRNKCFLFKPPCLWYSDIAG